MGASIRFVAILIVKCSWLIICYINYRDLLSEHITRTEMKCLHLVSTKKLRYVNYLVLLIWLNPAILQATCIDSLLYISSPQQLTINIKQSLNSRRLYTTFPYLSPSSILTLELLLEYLLVLSKSLFQE